MESSPTLQNRVVAWRIVIFFLIIGLVFSLYIFRLFSLQILEGEQWLSQAEDNRTLDINLPALRGIIYDRNGTILARNIASYNVCLLYTSDAADE